MSGATTAAALAQANVGVSQWGLDRILPVLLGSQPATPSDDWCGSRNASTDLDFELTADDQHLKLQEWLDQRIMKMESRMIDTMDRCFHDLAFRVDEKFQQCVTPAMARYSGVSSKEANETKSVSSDSSVQVLETSVEQHQQTCEPPAGHPLPHRPMTLGRLSWIGQELSTPPASHFASQAFSRAERIGEPLAKRSAFSAFLAMLKARKCNLVRRRHCSVTEALAFQRPRLCGCFLLAKVVKFYLPAIMASSKCKKRKLDYIRLRSTLHAVSTMIEADQSTMYSMDGKNGNVNGKTKADIVEVTKLLLDKVDRNLHSHQDLFWYAGVPLDEFLHVYEESSKFITESESATQKLWELAMLVREVDEMSRYVGAAIDRADQLPLKLATLLMSCIAAVSRFALSYLDYGSSN